MKAVQYFSEEYLKLCRKATSQQVLTFLEDYRLMQAVEGRSKLISIKVPETLLSAFRYKCELHGVKYQTQIKKLMQGWLTGN